MVRQEAEAAGTEAPVLVVDPDARQRSHVSGLLERAGYRPVAVATGEQALEAVRRRRPWLVVLEVRLADISGYEVCRALREELGDALAIVLVSGDRTDPSDKAAGLQLGADDYLPKPLADDELLARVRALARRDHL